MFLNSSMSRSQVKKPAKCKLAYDTLLMAGLGIARAVLSKAGDDNGPSISRFRA